MNATRVLTSLFFLSIYLIIIENVTASLRGRSYVPEVENNEDIEQRIIHFGRSHDLWETIFDRYHTDLRIDPDCEKNPNLMKCLRFSKVEFTPDYEPPQNFELPLATNSYPIQGKTCSTLKESLSPSVICGDDPEYSVDVKHLINIVGGEPTHPSCDLTNPFWLEMEEVIDLALKKQVNENAPACRIMELPDLWSGFSLKQVADAVHNEFPGLHQANLIEALLGAKNPLAADHIIIPSMSKKELVRGVFMLADLNTWAVSVVGHDNFLAKWYCGRARPEEVAIRIHEMNERLETSCAPASIHHKIAQLDLTTQFDFTSYPEGSPAHPSWPAMHSAGSSLSLWLPVVCDLTAEQLYQVKLMDYAVAYGRTVAGVHYHEDNIAGLNMGQEIVARELPGYLSTRYGSNIRTVREKIEMYRFDWRNFHPNVGC